MSKEVRLKVIVDEDFSSHSGLWNTLVPLLPIVQGVESRLNLPECQYLLWRARIKTNYTGGRQMRVSITLYKRRPNDCPLRVKFLPNEILLTTGQEVCRDTRHVGGSLKKTSLIEMIDTILTEFRKPYVEFNLWAYQGGIRWVHKID